MLASDLYIISWITLLYASLMEKSTIRLPPRKTYKIHQKFLYKKKKFKLKERATFRVVICTSWRSTVKCTRSMAAKISPTPLRLCKPVLNGS